MQAQSYRQHARPEAHVVVKPVGWTAVVMQSGHVAAYPDSDIRRHIDASRIRIWFVLIDGRSPVNRNAADNKAEKYRQIQPVTPPHQELMLPGHEHAGLFPQLARRVRLTGRNPYCLVLGDSAGAITRILSVESVPFGSLSVVK